MADWDEEQKKIDAMFQPAIRGRFLSPLERTLKAARNGVKNPHILSEDEVRLVCETLLIQYAQMGIS